MSIERREVIVAVTDECLPALFTLPSGRPWRFVCGLPGLPDGAKLMGVLPEPLFFGRTLFKFTHESFAVVPECHAAPYLDVVVDLPHTAKG